MEKYVQEFEPQVKSLFSSLEFKGFDLKGFMSKVAMDFLEDLGADTNQLPPQELLRTSKYHCLMRFLKEAGLIASFVDLTKEAWNKKPKHGL